jgi:FKBP-type peptidyl-prolyl cis-trans isomerase FklB
MLKTKKIEMKLKQNALLLGGLMALSAFAQPQLTLTNQASISEPVPPDKEKLSYAIGMSVGGNIRSTVKRQDIDVNMDTIIQGMKDALTGQPLKLTEKEVSELLRHDLQTYLTARRQAEVRKLDAMAPQSKKQGEEFLARNATADGVKVLPDGLQYKVVKEGSGETPTSNDVAQVSYTGTLIDGTEFDKNEDFSTPLGRVIKGWQEALSMMKVGSKWRIFVPAALAYGERAQPPKIAPNSALIFDMELLGVKHMPSRPAFPPQSMHPTTTPTFNNTAMASRSTTNGAVVSGQIIRVPSADELKKGAKIEVIDPSATNAPPAPPSGK